MAWAISASTAPRTEDLVRRIDQEDHFFGERMRSRGSDRRIPEILYAQEKMRQRVACEIEQPFLAQGGRQKFRSAVITEWFRLKNAWRRRHLNAVPANAASIQGGNGVDFDHKFRLSKSANLHRRAGRHRVTVKLHANIDVLEVFVDVGDVSVGANQVEQGAASGLQSKRHVFENFSQLCSHISGAYN
jgi:hypothetical protein